MRRWDQRSRECIAGCQRGQRGGKRRPAIRKGRSKIKNQKSKIGNRRSKIEDRRSNQEIARGRVRCADQENRECRARGAVHEKPNRSHRRTNLVRTADPTRLKKTGPHSGPYSGSLCAPASGGCIDSGKTSPHSGHIPDWFPVKIISAAATVTLPALAAAMQPDGPRRDEQHTQSRYEQPPGGQARKPRGGRLQTQRGQRPHGLPSRDSLAIRLIPGERVLPPAKFAAHDLAIARGPIHPPILAMRIGKLAQV
jgi:hypothetical protein